MERNIQLQNAKLVANVSLALLLVTYAISIASVFTYIYTHDIAIKYHLFGCLLGLIALSIIHNKALSKISFIEETRARQKKTLINACPNELLTDHIARIARTFLNNVLDSNKNMIAFTVDLKKHTAIINAVYVFNEEREMRRVLQMLKIVQNPTHADPLFSTVDINFDIYEPSNNPDANYGDITCRFKIREDLIIKAKEGIIEKALNLTNL